MARPRSAHGRDARATSVQLPEVQQENVGDTSNMLESEEPSEPLGPAPSRCCWQMCRSVVMQMSGFAVFWSRVWQSGLHGPMLVQICVAFIVSKSSCAVCIDPKPPL